MAHYGYLIVALILLMLSYMLLMYVRGNVPEGSVSGLFFREAAGRHVRKIEYIRNNITLGDCENVRGPLRELKSMLVSGSEIRPKVAEISKVPANEGVRAELHDILAVFEMMAESPTRYDTHLAGKLIDEIYSKMCRGKENESMTGQPSTAVRVWLPSTRFSVPQWNGGAWLRDDYPNFG